MECRVTKFDLFSWGKGLGFAGPIGKVTWQRVSGLGSHWKGFLMGFGFADKR
jgi:hypothetical protein